MNLPTDFPRLNDLLEQMGVELRPFVAPETRAALVGPGITVTTDNITVAPNGTLEYQGQKVILYIRDVRGSLPKYHVVDCQTLRSMRNAGRHKRYVVTRRTDGEFLLNFSDNLSRDNPETYRLDVCKNCLWGELNLKYLTPDAFPLADWFNAIDPGYEPPPRDGLYGPITTPATGPLSNYPPDWNLRSLQCRERANWECEECSIDLRLQRRFLHAHHRRGIQHNHLEDLRALCVGCHAKQPGHGRMRNLIYYQEFMELYRRIWEQLTRN